jgi:formiminoglutamase
VSVLIDCLSNWLDIRRCSSPLVVSFPHAGTKLPQDMPPDFLKECDPLADTDWHVDELVFPVVPEDATIIRTSISRSVIDVNRPRDNSSLYSGAAGTSLCPVTDFDGNSLYARENVPSPEQIESRTVRYYDPFHAALTEELVATRERCGIAILIDFHSIRPRVERLFDGYLPALNIGSNSGRSCAAGLTAGIADVCRQSPFTWVLDGRFKGGWITRHHGKPGDNVHAVQIEIAMNAYLQRDLPTDYARPKWRPDAARLLQTTLTEILKAGREFADAQQP